MFLENLDTGEKINYKIVGKDEADLKQKLIYFKSPIGKGLIGKNKKDLVVLQGATSDVSTYRSSWRNNF